MARQSGRAGSARTPSSRPGHSRWAGGAIGRLARRSRAPGTTSHAALDAAIFLRSLILFCMTRGWCLAIKITTPARNGDGGFPVPICPRRPVGRTVTVGEFPAWRRGLRQGRGSLGRRMGRRLPGRPSDRRRDGPYETEEGSWLARVGDQAGPIRSNPSTPRTPSATSHGERSPAKVAHSEDSPWISTPSPPTRRPALSPVAPRGAPARLSRRPRTAPAADHFGRLFVSRSIPIEPERHR
jgi:hypothetical protein